MKQAYPVFIAEYLNTFLVYVPDMDIYTEGNSFVDAIEMARDAIGLKGIDFEDDGIELPIPSTQENAIGKAKDDSEIFDYSTGLLTYVDVDFSEYRRRHENKTVHRNVTLPNWLNIEAEKAHVNVSKVLQGFIPLYFPKYPDTPSIPGCPWRTSAFPDTGRQQSPWPIY